MLIGTDILFEAAYLKLLFGGFFLQKFCSSEQLLELVFHTGNTKGDETVLLSLCSAKLHDMEIVFS